MIPKEREHMCQNQNLTHDKKRKINLISDMVLVMILFMPLLDYSNYTHKKREAVAAFFEDFHHSNSKDLPEIGAKNIVRSSPEAK